MEKNEQKEAFRRRTKSFAAAVIRLFARMDCRREEIRILGRQMLRSGTSVGANFREAGRSRSDAEFVAKIELCAQEADETQYWLELLMDECELPRDLGEPVWKEADELIRIFVTMAKNTKQRQSKT